MVPSRHRISFSAWFFKKQPSGRQILKSALNSDVRRQHAEDTSPSICIIPLPTPPYPPAPAPAPRTALNAITSPPSQLLTAQSLAVVVLCLWHTCPWGGGSSPTQPENHPPPPPRQNQGILAAEGGRNFFLAFVPPIPPRLMFWDPPQGLEKPTPPWKIYGTPPRLPDPWACMVCGKRKLPKQKKHRPWCVRNVWKACFFHSSSRLSCNLQKSVNARHFCPWRSPDHGMVVVAIVVVLLLPLAGATFVLLDLCKIQKNL